jgi:hypothetical protein
MDDSYCVQRSQEYAQICKFLMNFILLAKFYSLIRNEEESYIFIYSSQNIFVLDHKP